MEIGAKHAKTCMQCVNIPTEHPFCKPSLVVGKIVGVFLLPFPIFTKRHSSISGVCERERETERDVTGGRGLGAPQNIRRPTIRQGFPTFSIQLEHS